MGGAWMKRVLFATGELFRGAFRWRGRLSREGYWQGWLGVMVVKVILSVLACGGSDYLLYAAGIWNLAAFLPLLAGAVRRYHDAGRPGWLALLLGVPGRLLLVAGAVLGGITLLFFLFSAGAEVNMVGFLRLMGASVLLLLAGGALCIANLVLLLRPGDPRENAYGPPEPFPKG